MKVIFLDHDGVICLSTEWGGRYKKQAKWGGRKLSMSNREIPVEYRFDNYNKKAVKILNEILEKTGAEIVISSDWKLHGTLEELGNYYESQGIIKRPIDVTPNLGKCTWYNDKVWIWSPRWDLEMTRVIEIKQYLHDHPEVTHWVSIDDLDMGKNGESWKDWGLDNFVLTPMGNEGIKQSGIKEKILSFLM
jgi:HAD domain in Swiss Army Knife RNA repair proteins